MAAAGGGLPTAAHPPAPRPGAAGTGKTFGPADATRRPAGAREDSNAVTMQRGRGARCSGVTITEAVVASGLLLVCVVPLLRALTVAQAADRAIERKSWSLLLAQQELERLRACCARCYDGCYRTSSATLRDGYLCTIDDDKDPVLRTVTVSVGLDRDGDGVLSPGEVEVSLCTRLARRGPGPQL
jgi:hypothetical protein